jgi:hypothetical protein
MSGVLGNSQNSQLSRRRNPREVRISQTIAEEKNCGAHVRKESDSASHGTQSAERLGMANQSPQGRLQPRVQQNDLRLFSFSYGNRRSNDITIRLVDGLVGSLMKTSAPSPRDAI